MNLAELIRTGKGDRSYEQLARDCGGRPTAARLHQIASTAARSFPDPPTVRGLAKGLRVTEMTVVLAAAESLGLDVRRSGGRLVSLLPPDTDRLTDVQIDAVLAVIYAMARPVGPGEDETPAPRDVSPVEEVEEQRQKLLAALADLDGRDPGERAG